MNAESVELDYFGINHSILDRDVAMKRMKSVAGANKDLTKLALAAIALILFVLLCS